MSKERYEPNGDELEALLAEVLENWELCAAISSSVRTRQALQERASQIQQGLINEMGGISTADIQSSFDHVSRARRKRNRRIKKDLGLSLIHI